MQIKLFKKEKFFRKEYRSLSVDFYWRMAVCLVAISFIALLFFGYFHFMKLSDEKEKPNVGTSQLNIVKNDRIDKVLEYFTIREQKSKDISNSPSPILDPSL